jgi:hypothetical protein
VGASVCPKTAPGIKKAPAARARINLRHCNDEINDIDSVEPKDHDNTKELILFILLKPVLWSTRRYL